jgi:CTP synthase
VTELRSRGIQPDAIVCRSEQPLSPTKRKISTCDVDVGRWSTRPTRAHPTSSPVLHEEGLTTRSATCSPAASATEPWEDAGRRVEAATTPVKIGLIGKYVSLPDAYLSVAESLRHAGYAHGAGSTSSGSRPRTWRAS